MDWWALIIGAVVALTAVVVAYMVDARSSREREQILSSPPDRPGLSGEGSPEYVTGDEIRAGHVSRPATNGADVDDRLDGAVMFDFGWVSEDFITDAAAKRTVLESPVVLVAESVGYMADLVPVIQVAGREDTGLVVAAGEITPDVVTTLAMNAMAGRLACVCVAVDDCDAVAGAAGASVVLASDLRSGYVPESVLGRPQLWVSTSERTWIVQPQPNSSR